MRLSAWERQSELVSSWLSGHKECVFEATGEKAEQDSLYLHVDIAKSFYANPFIEHKINCLLKLSFLFKIYFVHLQNVDIAS